MARYRKKPKIIEAWHWRYDETQDETPSWVKVAMNKWPDTNGMAFEPEHPGGARMSIATLEGVMTAQPGDWIIQGIKGELYPCKPDIFEASYEPVD